MFNRDRLHRKLYSTSWLGKLLILLNSYMHIHFTLAIFHPDKQGTLSFMVSYPKIKLHSEKGKACSYSLQLTAKSWQVLPGCPYVALAQRYTTGEIMGIT